jgi:3D (Asp-Asp-Asp) domain-containing protein
MTDLKEVYTSLQVSQDESRRERHKTTSTLYSKVTIIHTDMQVVLSQMQNFAIIRADIQKFKDSTRIQIQGTSANIPVYLRALRKIRPVVEKIGHDITKLASVRTEVKQAQEEIQTEIWQQNQAM